MQINPIFKEYIQFLKDNKVDLDLQEGCYWLDKQIIKAYDKGGNIQKIARIVTDDKLNITYKTYKDKIKPIEPWEDTITRNKTKLKQLEENSIKLIQSKLSQYHKHQPIILTSGGKDSSVTQYLVRQVDPSVVGMFNNTSLDCADTYRHIKTQDNIWITNPKVGFYQWLKTNIIPTRFGRGCCRVFKEGEMISCLNVNEKYLFFMGMRNEESPQRSGYQDEWKNEKWGKRNWLSILPIRSWTEEEIWLYILWKNIDVNSKYKKGYARVGCAIACPFYAKSTWILDKYWYPKGYKRWHKILEKDFKENHKWVRMNCTLEEYHTCWNGGKIRVEPTEEVINEFADYKEIDIDVARKYFNNVCCDENCKKKVLDKNVIAMNLKLNGRETQKIFCKKHLQELYGLDKSRWNEYIREFKMSGCDLF